MTINEAIRTLQRAKREQAKLILQGNNDVNDLKEAMSLAGQTYIYRRTGHNTVEGIAFGAESTSVCHGSWSSRGIVLDIDVEY